VNSSFGIFTANSAAVYSVIGDLSGNQNANIPGVTPPTGRVLDAGTVTIAGSKGSIPAGNPGGACAIATLTKAAQISQTEIAEESHKH
jgi:hypothetical protein